MADLAITAANVVPDADATVNRGSIAGDTITAGMPIFEDTGDGNKMKPCEAGAEASSVCAGIALNGASDGQPVDYITAGDFTVGATVVVGISYFATNAGGMGVWAEVAVAEYASLVCVGISTTKARIVLANTGAVKAA